MEVGDILVYNDWRKGIKKQQVRNTERLGSMELDDLGYTSSVMLCSCTLMNVYMYRNFMIFKRDSICD